MSLLEDIFLQDEANEAQELERVIEGDEFEERARSDSDDNSEKEDEAEEDKRRVEPNTTKAKRIIKNPRFVLNPARLTGPRGIQVIPEHFKDFKFKGKGHEKEDLDLVLKKLEHWAYRLYPKFQFEDCLKKIETLGKKKTVMVHLHKIRSDQFVSEQTVVQKDSSDEEMPREEPEEDEFDRLLQQQIELARSTPAPNSVKKTPLTSHSSVDNRFINIPKATTSPSISDEQRERMLRSKKLAEEKRLARLKNDLKKSNTNQSHQNVNAVHTEENTEKDELEIGKHTRHNKSNVIDSSDDEDSAITYINESVSVDIHLNNKEPNDKNEHSDEENVTKPHSIEDAIVDEDSAITYINESVSVDIHFNSKEPNDKNEHSDEENVTKPDSIEDAIVSIDNDKMTNESTVSEIDTENATIHDNSKNTEIGRLNETQFNIINMDKANETNKQILEEIANNKEVEEVDINADSIVMDQEVLSNKEQVGEIMDVDFSEEF